MKKLHGLICLLIVVGGVATGAYFFLRQEESRSEDMESLASEDIEVLAIVAEGSDYWELYGVNRTLAREGITLTTASFTTEELFGRSAQVSFDEVDISRYDVVFIPGGDGPENIINHPDGQKVFDILIQANDQGKIIAAICHGPWVLAPTDLVEGKDVTCARDANMKNDLTNSGANVDTTRSVVRDGNIITANGPYATNAFAEEIIDALIENMASS